MKPVVADRLRDPERLEAAMLAAQLGAPPDRELDRICAATSKETRIRTCLVNVVLANEVRAMGSHGIPWFLKRVPARATICAVVAAQGEPIMLADDDTPEALSGCFGARLTRFYVGVPVFLAGESVGAIAVTSTQPRPGRAGAISRVLSARSLEVSEVLSRRERDRNIT